MGCLYAKKLSKPCRLIPYSHTKDFRSRLVELLPGKEIGEHATHESEELIIVIGGKVSVCDKSRSVILSAPGAALIPPHTLHNVKNKSKKKAKYIYVIRRR